MDFTAILMQDIKQITWTNRASAYKTLEKRFNISKKDKINYHKHYKSHHTSQSNTHINRTNNSLLTANQTVWHNWISASLLFGGHWSSHLNFSSHHNVMFSDHHPFFSFNSFLVSSFFLDSYSQADFFVN
jgi:hypothetical protein